MIRFGSVCSGIEAASVAWEPLGWQAAWLSEIEPFPCAVLAHHYPEVPNLGDMTALPDRIASGDIEAPDVFCGGTPCQAFSVAGQRKSLDDVRGNLSLTFCEIANAIDDVRRAGGKPPAIVFWENVPGVLSTKDNAFGCFLAGLAGEDVPLVPAGDKWTNAGCVFGPQRAVAWRVLDAQYFGVAQRRRRVFVVASARDGFDPTEVLFEFEGVRRDTAPSREAWQKLAPTIAGCANRGGANGPVRDADSAESLQVITMAHGQGGAEIGIDRGPMLTCNHEAPIAFVQNSRDEVRLMGGDGGIVGALAAEPGMKQQCYVAQPIPFDTTQVTSPANYSNPKAGDPCHPLAAGAHAPAVAVALRGRDGGATAELGDEVQNCLRASSGGGDKPHVLTQMAVRRLTPVECERLQGFPDGYTAIPWRKKPASECPDGPRYKALGNSWAVPNVRWIGKRIDAQIRAYCGSIVEPSVMKNIGINKGDA